MTNEDRVFIDRIETAIDDKDTDTMRALVEEWDGRLTMSRAQFKSAYPDSSRREWREYLEEECIDLIKAIKCEDADDYWTLRSRA